VTRKKTVFVVAPHATDPDFEPKMAVVARVAADLGMSPAWALITAERETAYGLGALKNADIVIADLSFERPSCYFEVGFAQALGKPVALIAKGGTAIHQLIGGEAVLFYNTISDYEDAIRQALSGHSRTGIQGTRADEADAHFLHDPSPDC
jgi:nucleoside 2-deoxyribosyltransferase